MAEPVEVVVVGASACGGLAAREAARAGADVVIVEEDNTPGKFHKCSGLYSKSGLQRLAVNYKDCIVHEIKGATIHAGRHTFVIDKQKTVAFVLDRQKLDEEICAEAVSAGAELKLGQRIVKKTSVGIASNSEEFSFNYLIGADGVSSAISSLYGFSAFGTGNIAMCYEAEFENCNLADADKVDVFLDSAILPGFFGWIIPAGGGKARIGFGTTQHRAVKSAFEKFFQFSLIKSTIGGDAKKLREFWHSIPLRVKAQTQKENVFLVGDAAGQTKSTTGGGVIFGGQCAMIAGRVAAAGGNNYEEEWRKKFSPTLRAHRLVRKSFDSIPQWAVKLSVLGLDKLLLSKLVENFGDMDYIAAPLQH